MRRDARLVAMCAKHKRQGNAYTRYIYFVLVVGLFEGYDGMLWIIMNNILYSVFFFASLLFVRE